MLHLLLPLLLSAFQVHGTAEGNPEPLSVDEQVALDAIQITEAVKAFAAAKESKLKLYSSADGRVQLYSDARSKEVKAVLKLTESMLAKLDESLGSPVLEEGQSGELLGFVINKSKAYYGLCNAIAAAAPSQSSFMSSSKDTTGFTIFSPELTVYFNGASIQQEARLDYSMAHNFIHLEMERRYGELPLWIREAIATALEDIASGEVWGPWHRNDFVFAVSHTEWRGKETQQQIESLQNFESIFSYKANPYIDQLAHVAFAFAVYTLTEEPQGLAKVLSAMQEMYPETNPKGGRSNLTAVQTTEIVNENFGPGLFVRFKEWWAEPKQWDDKPKKSKSKKR